MAKVKREEIPLRMIEGNIGVLLDNVIEVQAISLRPDPGSVDGVLLIVKWGEGQAAKAKALGFKTANLVDEER